MPSFEPKEEDVIRILISSDNHLGYAEKSPIKYEDSFATFDEILEIGQNANVDMVLLGGDLFHENKPSRQTEMRAMQILRDRVYGDNPVQIHLVSDPNDGFSHCSGRKDVNYTDPNLNIGLPIFSIHGNHDDPAGMGGFSVLDKLHAAGLVNYFGKVLDLKDISIKPICLVKGQTKLALYGMSSVKDERLHRLYRDEKVKLTRPEEDIDSWFNLFVLHQNRAPHGSRTNYVPEHFIDGFFHFVLWGHEHECRITPEKSVFGDDKSFFVCQPGSSVATSLCEAETKEKKVAILSIYQTTFKMEEISLQTVRPMVFKTIWIEEEIPELVGMSDEKKAQKKIEAYLVHYVNELIEEEVPHLLTGHPKQPKLPLIRVRVEYKEEAHQLQAARFGSHFHMKVANHAEILLFRKRAEKKEKSELFDDKLMAHLMPRHQAGSSMEDLVAKYFSEINKNGEMQVLGVQGIGNAVKRYIEKEDKESLGAAIDRQLKKTLDALENAHVEPQDVDEELERLKAERNKNPPKQDEEEVLPVSSRPDRNHDDQDSDDNSRVMVQESESEPESPPKRGRGRSKAPPKAPAARRGRGRGRGSAKTPVVNSIKAAFTRQSQRHSNRSIYQDDSE